MSIKSEKAKEYLISITEDVAVEYPFVNSDCFMIKQGDAKKAIELAEFDAEQRCRERAVRAFKYACPQRSISSDYCDVRDNLYSGDCAPCDKYKQFLKNYDNEK